MVKAKNIQFGCYHYEFCFLWIIRSKIFLSDAVDNIKNGLSDKIIFSYFCDIHQVK